MTDDSSVPGPMEGLEDLDPLIEPYVRILRRNGIETVQSCQGGEGHSFPRPTIRFTGSMGALWRALSILLNVDAGVSRVQIVWRVGPDQLPSGPVLEVVLYDLERELSTGDHPTPSPTSSSSVSP